MKSIWNGSVGFGLVNIPVKLYSATEERRLNLDMLDKHDLSRIRYKRVNETTGKEVAWGDIVKGYLMDDEYIVITDEDFEKASAKKSKVIEITEFVDEDKIANMLFKKPYYLEPEKGGARSYALLRDALKKTQKVGVATFVLRQKESLALVSANEDVLMLHVIRFSNEIRDTGDLDLPVNSDIKHKELDMAVHLIEQYSKEFDLSEYNDIYNDELMKVIEDKAKGKKTKVKKMEAAPTKSQDLMAQLKASLDQKKKKAS
jgi:DNA end-binding protein Ku